MYKLYSERIKNRDGEAEVYIYDEFPEAFRNQVFYLMLDVLNKCSNNNEKFWDILFDRFWTTMPQGVLHVKLIEPPCTERYARRCERSEFLN